MNDFLTPTELIEKNIMIKRFFKTPQDIGYLFRALNNGNVHILNGIKTARGVVISETSLIS